MINDFKDKTVAITGGATGIGFALAKAMGEQGARIVIGEPRENRLSEAVEALGKLGPDARSMVMDVPDPDSVEAFADFAWDAFGSVHVLINNAGIMACPLDRVGPAQGLRCERLRRLAWLRQFRPANDRTGRARRDL